MKQARSLLAALTATSCLLSACASSGAQIGEAPALDWEARWMHVHVDHVSDAGRETFEGARMRWLTHLRADGGSLADGRPLFFSGQSSPGVRVYYTLYPFASWRDLDTRAAAKSAVEARLGAPALADYDSGDAALVPPHHSEIWTRLADDDIASLGAPLNEANAARIKLEYRTMPMGADRQAFEALWAKVRAHVGGQTIACRAFWNLYGGGELTLLWLARGSEAMTAATLDPALAEQLDRLAPLRERLDLERRSDLSTVAPRVP